MIKLENGQMAMEGQLGDLIIEAARVVDAVAAAVTKKADQEEITYDFAVEAILKFVDQVSKINMEDNVWGYDDEIKFLQEARDLRHQNKDAVDFIDYDSGSAMPTSLSKKKGKDKKNKEDKEVINPEIAETLRESGRVQSTTNITGGAKLDSFVLDSRLTEDDILDIEELRKHKSKSKKHKKD